MNKLKHTVYFWYPKTALLMLVTTLCQWLYDRDVGDRFNMLATLFVMLVIFQCIQSPKSRIGQQHLKVVTNTFHLQNPSPTSMLPLIGFDRWNNKLLKEYTRSPSSKPIPSFPDCLQTLRHIIENSESLGINKVNC